MLPRHGPGLGSADAAAIPGGAPAAIRYTVSALVLAAFGITATAAWRWLQPKPVIKVQVGPHELAPGEHYVGDPLPRNHPMRRVVYRASADPAAPVASAPEAAQPATLQLRRHCAWGEPGRDPYRGTVEEALRTAQLPETVVHRIAEAVRAKRPSDRLTISNTGIHADQGGQIYNQRSFAMTYGRTLCLGTSVNFPIGHVERASLYAAADDQGKLHTVMVPDVCGNVSVLRVERAASDEAYDGDLDGPSGTKVAGGAAAASGATGTLPEPGTLACVAVGVVAAVALRRRQRAGGRSGTTLTRD